MGAVNGSTPFDSLMFDFVSGQLSVDVYQIVDVTSYAAQIDAGLVTARPECLLQRCASDPRRHITVQNGSGSRFSTV